MYVFFFYFVTIITVRDISKCIFTYIHVHLISKKELPMRFSPFLFIIITVSFILWFWYVILFR